MVISLSTFLLLKSIFGGVNILICAFTFRNRLIDGTEVIYETCERKPSHHEESPRRGPDEPQIGHHDCITDIALTKLPQNFVISGSMDGVIKVWK